MQPTALGAAVAVVDEGFG
ncbi:unnamed protein product, partial [Rotaria sp. Silwood1]